MVIKTASPSISKTLGADVGKPKTSALFGRSPKVWRIWGREKAIWPGSGARGAEVSRKTLPNKGFLLGHCPRGEKCGGATWRRERNCNLTFSAVSRRFQTLGRREGLCSNFLCNMLQAAASPRSKQQLIEASWRNDQLRTRRYSK